MFDRKGAAELASERSFCEQLAGVVDVERSFASVEERVKTRVGVDSYVESEPLLDSADPKSLGKRRIIILALPRNLWMKNGDWTVAS